MIHQVAAVFHTLLKTLCYVASGLVGTLVERTCGLLLIYEFLVHGIANSLNLIQFAKLPTGLRLWLTHVTNRTSEITLVKFTHSHIRRSYLIECDCLFSILAGDYSTGSGITQQALGPLDRF